MHAAGFVTVVDFWSLSRASIKQAKKKLGTGYSESSGSRMPTKNPEIQTTFCRRNTLQPDNDAITKHLQDLLSPAIYAQSAYMEVWDSESGYST